MLADSRLSGLRRVRVDTHSLDSGAIFARVQVRSLFVCSVQNEFLGSHSLERCFEWWQYVAFACTTPPPKVRESWGWVWQCKMEPVCCCCTVQAYGLKMGFLLPCVLRWYHPHLQAKRLIADNTMHVLKLLILVSCLFSTFHLLCTHTVSSCSVIDKLFVAEIAT